MAVAERNTNEAMELVKADALVRLSCSRSSSAASRNNRAASLYEICLAFKSVAVSASYDSTNDMNTSKLLCDY